MLCLIRNFTHKRDKARQSIMDLVQAGMALYMCYQCSMESTAEYMQNFQAKVEVIKEGGRTPGFSRPATDMVLTGEKLVQVDLGNSHKKVAAAQKMATTQYLTALAFAGLNIKKHKALKTEVTNAWLLGKNRYPWTLAEVLKLAGNYHEAMGAR